MRWMLLAMVLSCDVAAPKRANVSFSTAPRAAVPRQSLGLAKDFPARAVFVQTNGLVNNTYSMTIDLSGTLSCTENMAPNIFSKERSWSRPLTAAELDEIVALADRVWREPPDDPKNPASEYHETIMLVDGKDGFRRTSQTGFLRGAAQALMKRMGLFRGHRK